MCVCPWVSAFLDLFFSRFFSVFRFRLRGSFCPPPHAVSGLQAAAGRAAAGERPQAFAGRPAPRDALPARPARGSAAVCRAGARVVRGLRLECLAGLRSQPESKASLREASKPYIQPGTACPKPQTSLRRVRCPRRTFRMLLTTRPQRANKPPKKGALSHKGALCPLFGTQDLSNFFADPKESRGSWQHCAKRHQARPFCRISPRRSLTWTPRTARASAIAEAPRGGLRDPARPSEAGTKPSPLWSEGER